MIIEGIYGEWYDRVYVNGRLLDPKASLKVANHSPDGFAWGYAGSGPAQLALAILLKAGLPAEQARQLHQDFKREFIEGLPSRRDFELELDVKKWAEYKLQSRGGENHVHGDLADPVRRPESDTDSETES